MLDNRAFTSPSAEYRPVPMWFWNDDLDEAELRRQVQAMAEGGLGGFQIAARTGLATPYLSDRWFSLVTAATHEGQRHGLNVWLADEYPYPSGATGGEVTQRHPEYRAWEMRAHSEQAAPGQHARVVAPGAILLYAAAVPVVDRTSDWTRAVDLRSEVGISQPEPVLVEPAFGLSNKRSFSYGPVPVLEWTAPVGPNAPDAWEIWLIAAAEVAPYKFFGHYVDLCNPDAVRYFLETTYQRYAERLDPATFAQLTGFFLDEAHPPTWPWGLPTFFQERNGYDLVPLLPAIWTNVGPRTAQVRYDYYQTLSTLFVDSFHRPVADWCRAHGVQLSLEVDSLRNSCQRYAHLGGNDPGHEKVGVPLEEIQNPPRPRYRVNPRFAASLAAQVGQPRVLNECFHSIGWSMTLQDMKAVVNRMAALGANFFIFHAFSYSLGGLRKWDAPPSQFYQNPYWPRYPRFTDYVGRLCYALSSGRRVAPIALLDPITSLWSHGATAMGSHGPGAGPDGVATRVAADWRYLLRELEAAQRLYDTLDPLLLAEGTVEGGELRLGEAAYKVIVLPPQASLEAAAWAKLAEFARGGGTVIGCGLLPFETIETQSDVIAQCAKAFGVDAAAAHASYLDEAEEKAGNTGSIEIVRGESFAFLRTAGTLAEAGAAQPLLALLESLAPAEIVLKPDAGDVARRSFLVNQRCAGNETLTFIANADGSDLTCDVEIRLAGSGTNLAVERLELEDGSREPVSYRLIDDASGARKLVVSLPFSRYGSQLLSIRENAATPGAAAPRPIREVGTVDLPVDSAWCCALDRDNALRFDRFRFGIVAKPSAGNEIVPEPNENWPTIEPKPLVNVQGDLERSGLPWPLPLRVETSFGTPAQVKLKLPVAAWYSTEFEVATVPEHAALCLEREAFLGAWAVWLNGQRISAEAFQAKVRWDVTNREANVRPLLRPGRNRLSLRVIAEKPTNGLVDAVYLLGDFGVSYAPAGVSVVDRVPTMARLGSLHVDGLPHYAGAVRLTSVVSIPIPPNATEEATVALRLPDDLLMYLGIAELTLNGHDLGPRAWAPYRWPAPVNLLRAEGNEVTVTLTTTLAGLLEGKRYDPARREAVRVVSPTGQTGR